MATIKLTYQPLILTTAGEQPSLPSPANITPDHEDWNDSSNLLVGQLAYNVVDDKWYYRGNAVGIQELNTGGAGASTLYSLSDTDLPISIPNGAFLQYNEASSDWVSITDIDAATLDGSTKQDIIDSINTSLSRYHALTELDSVPSAVGWYAISRWKTLNCNFETVLVTHPVGGLNYESTKITGLVNSINADDWSVKVSSTGGTSFTNARLSQYEIAGENYTYLEVYKNIPNVGNFSILAYRSEFNYLTDNSYEFEAISFGDVSALSPIRRSIEYHISEIVYNVDNKVKLTTEGVVINSSLQAGEDSPKVRFFEIPIGEWDMSTTTIKTVSLPNGVAHNKIIDGSVMIYNSANTESSPLSIDGYWYVTNSNEVELVISENGYYNTSDFSGSADRGTIFINVKN